MVEQRDMSGSLSKNDKGGVETRPDLRGHITIGGVKYWLSGWKKENDRGVWYSLAAQPADKVAGTAPVAKAPARVVSRNDDLDDSEIPF